MVAQVFEYLSGFRKYDWLWKEDKDVQYKRFVESNPAISDYEAELAKFMDIESEIESIPTFHNVGPLTLNTTNLKLQLGSESRQWKIQYSNKVLAYCSASQKYYKLRARRFSQIPEIVGVVPRDWIPAMRRRVLVHTDGCCTVDVPVSATGNLSLFVVMRPIINRGER